MRLFYSRLSMKVVSRFHSEKEKEMPRKQMTEEERKEVSNRMKKYWANRRDDLANGKKPKAKNPKAEKPKAKKRVSKSEVVEEIKAMKVQTMQAARFIKNCGSTKRAREVFNMVIKLAENMK